jgi:hypothetical protein
VKKSIPPQEKDTKDILAKRLSGSRGQDNILVPPNNTELKSQARCFTFGVIESVKHEFKEDMWDEFLQPTPSQVCGLYHVTLTKG